MIITIKGASYTFNIGQLDSWFISRSIGSGATYDGVTSVKKDEDEAFNATVTLADGYEIGSAGVSVTMGGSDITSTAVTISGSVITIFISSVTGNVVISVPTKNIATGDEDDGGSGGDGSTTTPTETYYFKDQANIGYLRGGQYIESAKSATTDYIDISSKPKIGYYGRMGYVSGDTFHALEFYDENKTYLSDLSVLGTGQQMYVNIDLSESKYVNAKYVRASVSQSSFTTEQFNTWYFIVGSFIEEAPTLDTVISMFPSLGYLDLTGNKVEASSNAYITDYVSLSGKSNIDYKGRMGTIGLNIAFYDSSKTFISGLETIGDGTFITLNINLSDAKYANAAYVRASISKGSLDETTWFSSSFKIS